jgi:hypothetical protein
MAAIIAPHMITRLKQWAPSQWQPSSRGDCRWRSVRRCSFPDRAYAAGRITRPLGYGLALGFLWLIAAPSVRAAELTGVAVFTVDGNTFDLRVGNTDTRIRACGIDSPERGQPGYRQAKDAMRAVVDGKTVRCVQVGVARPATADRSPLTTTGWSLSASWTTWTLRFPW